MAKFSQFSSKAAAVAIVILVTLLFVSFDMNRADAVTDSAKESVTESQNYDLEKIFGLEEKEATTDGKPEDEKEEKPKTKPSKPKREVKLSFNHGNFGTEIYSQGLNVSYLKGSGFGLDVSYNVYEELRYRTVYLKECDAGILYRPAKFEEFTVKMGLKFVGWEASDYKKYEDIKYSTLGKSKYNGETEWGPMIEFLGSTSLINWIELFGEIGATLIANEVLTEFGGGLCLKVVSPVEIKFNLRQIGLSGADWLHFGGGVISVGLTFK